MTHTLQAVFGCEINLDINRLLLSLIKTNS